MAGERVRTWTLWATCDECGDIEVRTAHAALRYANDTGDFSVSYACPVCGRRDAVNVVDSYAIGALFAAGMQPVPWSLTPDPPPPGLRPLTLSEVDELAAHLYTDDWLAENCPQ